MYSSARVIESPMQNAAKTIARVRTMPDESPSNATNEPAQIPAAWLPIQEALRGLRFGQVTITVHDGVVVQIDRTERRRLQRGRE